MRFEGILLAAGESRRMGYPKPLLKLGDQTFIAHLSSMMLRVVPRLVVVLGAWADRIRPAIPLDSRIRIVENQYWADGQLSSLKTGLVSLDSATEAALVHLADHPMVLASTFEALIREYELRKVSILIARAEGRRGHPLVFGASIFRELMDASDAVGAKQVVNLDPGRVAYLDVDDRGIGLDLDTPADLAAVGLTVPSEKKD
ncbi:MAG: nucleotidyltransferase family protein [Candidatus Binataceae bacterium]|nr:nucleotidyltransferase family protein [Candidatus Binataceae bacterium]